MYNAIMPRLRRSDPMPVKYWSRAGLLLTDWCNARCASCYLGCGPDGVEEMTPDDAIAYWGGLIEASPHGCRVHLTGGEPFGDFPRLIEICRRAHAQRLAPLQKIETNAFWATDEGIVRERVGLLDQAGMERICVSTDPYHQQFVPIERCRLLVRIAEEVLGADRVQVRWSDWLEEGFDTGRLDAAEREKLFARYAAGGRDRFNGRAADALGKYVQCKSVAQFADMSCAQRLLRSRHVHIDASGRVMPGTCAGIVLGVVDGGGVAEIWETLDADHAGRPIVGTLSSRGPTGLLEEAQGAGFVPKDAYAGKCHLCWDIRGYLVRKGLGGRELGPVRVYG